MGEGRRKKVFDYARFTRKTYAQLAKTVQTRSFVAQTGQFQTPPSLVFRFIGRGQSLPSCVQFNSSCISIENIYKMHYGCILYIFSIILTIYLLKIFRCAAPLGILVINNYKDLGALHPQQSHRVARSL